MNREDAPGAAHLVEGVHRRGAVVRVPRITVDSKFTSRRLPAPCLCCGMWPTRNVMLRSSGRDVIASPTHCG